MPIPDNISAILDKLDASDQETIRSYFSGLEEKIDKLEGSTEDTAGDKKADDVNMADATNQKEANVDVADDDDDDDVANEKEEEDEGAEAEEAFPPLYESGEDYDKAAEFKQDAADRKAAGEWDKALEKYTAAVQAAPPSALLYANRATALLKLGRPRAAERDCDLALKENPDSAKALRVRGKVRKDLGRYEDALRDLSQAQSIDFDEGTVDDLKFLTQKHVEMERDAANKRIAQEEKLKKRASEIKRAQEEAKREREEEEARNAASGMGGMPGMGGMGGMPGMGGMGGMGGSMPGMGGMGGGGGGGGMPGMEGLMSAIMSDPELVAAMQKPKVQAALQEVMSTPGGPSGLMSNPAKLQELYADPEVGPVLTKLMSKLGAAGVPPQGGAGAGGAASGGSRPAGQAPNFGSVDDDDDIPDLEDLPEVD